MLALTLVLLAALGPGSDTPEHDLDPWGPGPPADAPADARASCDGRPGWVGDGEGGRDPPRCEGPDADLDDDPAGLHEPDWLRSEDDDGG